MSDKNKILEIKELQTSFFTDGGVIPSVDKISFEVKEAYNKQYQENETIHFNTIDKWFKEFT